MENQIQNILIYVAMCLLGVFLSAGKRMFTRVFWKEAALFLLRKILPAMTFVYISFPAIIYLFDDEVSVFRESFTQDELLVRYPMSMFLISCAWLIAFANDYRIRLRIIRPIWRVIRTLCIIAIVCALGKYLCKTYLW